MCHATFWTMNNLGVGENVIKTNDTNKTIVFPFLISNSWYGKYLYLLIKNFIDAKTYIDVMSKNDSIKIVSCKIVIQLTLIVIANLICIYLTQLFCYMLQYSRTRVIIKVYALPFCCSTRRLISIKCKDVIHGWDEII